MFGASPSCARPKTRIAVSCERTSMSWCSGPSWSRKRSSPSGRRRPIGDWNSNSTDRDRGAKIWFHGRGSVPGPGRDQPVEEAPNPDGRLWRPGAGVNRLGCRHPGQSGTRVSRVDGTGARDIARDDARVYGGDLLPYYYAGGTGDATLRPQPAQASDRQPQLLGRAERAARGPEEPVLESATTPPA